ncbi:MAG TPA: hypothetical protein VMT83_17455 [Burkholderiaceae bacterium]|nr:hypothetical protein [Burkholderiaceae bacterium]
MKVRPLHRALALGAVALLIGACSARDSASTPRAQRNTATTSPRARAAQRIVLPGAAEDAAAVPADAATIRRALPEAPEVIRLPDGTVGVKVAAQYFDTVVACRQADGSFGTNCPPVRQEQP